MTNTVWTIGHSNRTLEEFLDILLAKEINAIGDVRSVPFSRFASHFNQAELKTALAKNGIKYSFIGDQLGGRSNSPLDYHDHQIQYSRIRTKESYLSGLDRVISAAPMMRLALLCTEKDPVKCHRFILISMDLAERGLDINHIYDGTKTLSHRTVIENLIKEQSPIQNSLFSQDPSIEEILIKQEKKIAYKVNMSEDSKEVL